MSRKPLLVGLAALTAGIALIALSQTGGSSVAFAGEDECVTWTPTRTNTPGPTNTATNTPLPSETPTTELTSNETGGVQLVAFGNQTPQRTCVNTNTPTRTPTRTPTIATTATPVPPTTAPATNTPTGGSQGGGVQPPNTGFGDTGSDSNSVWFLIAGAALIAAGSGSVLAGVRRRS